MGYTTEFQGEIKIEPKLTHEQIVFFESMYGDMREWNSTDAEKYNFTWFDWELNGDRDALEWNGSEKFYDADRKMLYIIEKATTKYPELIFNGLIQAQGEDISDRWTLIVDNNKVSREEYMYECPECGYKWKDE